MGPARGDIHVGLFNVAGQAALIFTDYARLGVNNLDICHRLRQSWESLAFTVEAGEQEKGRLPSTDVYSCGIATYGPVSFARPARKLVGGMETPQTLIVGQSHTHMIVYIAPTGVSHGI